MTATAALTATPSTETFGLDPEKCPELIRKLRSNPQWLVFIHQEREVVK